MLPPTLRSVACAALLALASGCSQGSGDQAELYPVVDERGILTYRYRRDAPPPAAAAPTQAQAATARRPAIEQQFRVQARQEMQADEEHRQERELVVRDQIRREQSRMQEWNRRQIGVVDEGLDVDRRRAS